MQNVLWNLAAAFGFCLCISSGASASGSYTFEGVDITPLVNYYASQVVTLTKPLTVYNWSHHGPSPYWDKEPIQGSPSLVQMAKNQTHSFWSNFGNPKGVYNSCGFGLYAAADPITSFSYGGGNSNEGISTDWLLFEMQLPVGFKLLDLDVTIDKVQNVPDDVTKLMGQLECSTTTLDTLFENGGLAVSEHCRKIIKEIFSQDLKIDGFAYYYTTSPMKVCVPNLQRQFRRAFVLTNDEWITPKNVKFFTSLSRSDLDERALIQTIFLKYQDEQGWLNPEPEASKMTAQYMKDHPDTWFSSVEKVCEAESCTFTMHYCTSFDKCEDVKLKTIVRKSKDPLLTETEARQYAMTTKLLWPDLDGKAKTPNLDFWLNKNIYGCSGEAPFKTPAAQKGNL